MPARPTDPGIPTLTQRAEPTLYASPAPQMEDAPVLTELAEPSHDEAADDGFPLLTDVAEVAETLSQDWDVDEAPAVLATALPLSRTALPDASVLTARLQAEVEQLMRRALADAIDQMQTRMDAELPGIVARVLNEVKPG